MPRLSEIEVLDILNRLDADPDTGSMVQVQYRRMPGRPTTMRQHEESKIAADRGIPMNLYTGRLCAFWRAQNGDLVIRVKVFFERQDPSNPMKDMYRQFNVSRGELQSLSAK